MIAPSPTPYARLDLSSLEARVCPRCEDIGPCDLADCPLWEAEDEGDDHPTIAMADAEGV